MRDVGSREKCGGDERTWRSSLKYGTALYTKRDEKSNNVQQSSSTAPPEKKKKTRYRYVFTL